MRRVLAVAVAALTVTWAWANTLDIMYSLVLPGT